MKRHLICRLILTIQLMFVGSAFCTPDNPEDWDGTDRSIGAERVVMHSCDEAAWESSTGIDEGQAALQGPWTGHEADRKEEWSVTFTYSGRFDIKGPGGEHYGGRYRFDSSRDPKHLDLYIQESHDPTHTGKISPVIYKVDSNTLTFAMSYPGAESRPVSFASGPGSRVFVVVK